MHDILLNLLEAKVTLYSTRADGGIGEAIWSGQVAERLSVRERWIGLETRPTGAPFPVNHPLMPRYEISIDRVWALPLTALNGFSPTHQTYILDVTWTEEELRCWHRRTFHGVTIDARSFAPENIQSEFVDGQEFLAQYVMYDVGVASVPLPAITVPRVVVWNGVDGCRTLYTYTTEDGFAASNTDEAAARAIIAPDGSSIRFASQSGDAVAASESGAVVTRLHDELPLSLPQLLFYEGNALMAVVTPEGLWARNLADGTLPSGGMLLKNSGATVCAITRTITTAQEWREA